LGCKLTQARTRAEPVAGIEQRIGPTIEALMERVAEGAQGVESIGAFHSDTFCYRGLPQAILLSRFPTVQLKTSQRRMRSLSGPAG
jgi:hypothetical protein